MKNTLNKSFVNGRAVGHSSCRPIGHSSPRASCATARARSFALALLGFAALASANAYGVTATKAYVDSRDASLSAYTTGVSNKVEAAQSAAAANADAIAAETKARKDAGYLTAESDPSTALTNGVAWVRGKKVISEHQSLAAYLKTDDLASKETDPKFDAWRTVETNIAIGVGAHAGDFDKYKQENIAPTNGSIAIGQNAYASYSGPAVAIGKETYADWYAVAIGYGATNLSSSVAIGLRAFAENGSSVALGMEASCRADFGGLSLGAYSDSSGEQPTAVGARSFSAEQGAAFGVSSYAEDTGTAIGFESYAKRSAFGTRYNPDAFYFNSLKSDKGATARSLQSYLDERATTNDLAAVKAMISATDETFSNAVLQVGIGTLGITTNDLQAVHDLANLPVGTSITAVGGLLAALAAGLAALKKSVSSLSSKVDDANAALEEVA